MAEFVQLRLEEMRPELEQYVKFKLFKADEIRCVKIIGNAVNFYFYFFSE